MLLTSNLFYLRATLSIYSPPEHFWRVFSLAKDTYIEIFTPTHFVFSYIDSAKFSIQYTFLLIYYECITSLIVFDSLPVIQIGILLGLFVILIFFCYEMTYAVTLYFQILHSKDLTTLLINHLLHQVQCLHLKMKLPASLLLLYHHDTLDNLLSILNPSYHAYLNFSSSFF